MTNKTIARGFFYIEDFGRHLKHAVRIFRKQPAFAVAVTVLLGFGVGSVTAVFGIMNELMFKPRFATQPDQLFAISVADHRGNHNPFHVSPAYFEDYMQISDPSYRICGFALLQPKLRWSERLERTKVELVSGNYFGLLGLQPARGRFLDREDERNGGLVAVISERFWRRKFDSALDAIGQSIELNGCHATVVGIAPPGFHGLDTWDSDIWMSTSAERSLKEFTIYKMALRITSGASLPAVKARVSAATRDIVRKYNSKPPQGYESYGAINEHTSISLLSAGRGRLSPFVDHPEIWASFWLYLGIVAAVLIISWANISNLMLVRTLQRQREIAIRVALGASWRVLIKQCVTEGVVFAFVGAGVGLVLAFWLNGVLLSWSPPETRFMAKMELDLRVFAFALLLSAMAALTFGLAPALYAFRQRIFDSLRLQSGTSSGPHSHAFLQRSFVACQIAICVVLLTGAALCFRSFNRLAAVAPGFQTENVLFLALDLEQAGYQKAVAAVHVAELIQGLRSVPGTKEISFAKTLPLMAQKSLFGVYALDGYEKRPGEQSIMVPRSQVGPNYFKAMGIPLLSGQEMTWQAQALGKQVIIVNESFVRRYWPKLDPIGKKIFGFEVVGVAKDSRTYSLWEPAEPHLYFQSVEPPSLNLSFIVRTAMNPAQTITGVRSAVESYNNSIRMTDVLSVNTLMRRSLADRQFALQLLGCLAVIATFLSAIGTYSLMSYLVSRRVQEIGVRMALGASKKDIVALIMRYGLKLALTGIGLGLVATLGASQVIRKWLYNISAVDPGAISLTCLLMVITAMLASFLPARRAASVNPTNALRSE